MYIELDDFRQSFVVAKNEILKFIRGKKFLAYCIMIALVFALWTLLPFALGESFTEAYGGGNIIPIYLAFMSILIIVGATLFASNVIVSEFEERTALVLFTRPVKRTSIFVGKVLGCIIVESSLILLYYLGVAIILLWVDGRIPPELFKSLGLASMYILSASGVAVAISSILKKSSTSAVLTFFSLLIIISMVSVALFIANIDPWFMLDQAANEMAPSSIVGGMPVIPMEHAARACGVMAAWCVATMVLAWIAFIRREF
jgi:ABC-2 type transport system permease protein